MARFFQAQTPQPGQLDGLSEHRHGASAAEAAHPLFLAFEGRIANLAPQLPLLLEVAAPEELGEGAVQIAQRLLRRALDTVGESVTAPASAPKPYVTISRHTAPQSDGLCH